MRADDWRETEAAGGGGTPEGLLAHTLAHAETVLASLADGVIVKDDRNDIAWCNEAAAAIFGVRVQDMLGLNSADPCFDPRHPDGSPFSAAELPSSRVLAAGAPVLGAVLDVARGDGTRTQVEMSTKPLLQRDGSAYGAVTVVRDVTARMAEIEAVRFQAALLDAVGQAVVATDVDGSITYWNRAAEEMYGWTAEQALGRDVVALVVASTSAAELDAITSALGEGVSWAGEMMVRDRLQRAFPAMVTTRPLLAPDGTRRGLIAVSIDLSERKRSERAMRRLSAIVASSADAILSVTLDGRIDSWNLAAETLFGYTEAEILGQPVDVLASSGHGTDLRRLHQAARAGRTTKSHPTVWQHRDRDPIDVSVTISPVLGTHGDVVAVSAVAQDTREQRAMQRAIEHQALHDSLTGLANRAALDDRLGDALDSSSRGGGPVSVLFIDLDFFKAINDAVGHRTGDAVLIEIARRLSAVVGTTGLVARFGGDEFVVVMEDADSSAAHRCAERISDALREPVSWEGHRYYVTSSIGIALSPAADPEELLARADAAMYEAKARGRDRVSTSNDHVRQETRKRLVLATELRQALESDELTLHYQPIVEMETGEVVGAEALCRWTHPVLGSVAPDRFVAVAESSGLIAALDRWVLRRAAVDTRSLVERRLLGPHGQVAVNLSAQTVADIDLEALVRRAVEDARIPYDALALEVTETGMMSDPEAAAGVLGRLRDRGVGVHVDDFGTGYSSLSYLRRLPISAIKIDRTFIKDLTTAPDDVAITMAIIEMSRSLGIRTIAEGVETPEQLALLRQRGCWAGQGYLWSPALPLPALVELLERASGTGSRVLVAGS